MWERDVEAVARALDPVAFWPRREHGGSIRGVSETYWDHIRSRRKSARASAQTAMEKLVKRGWRSSDDPWRTGA